MPDLIRHNESNHAKTRRFKVKATGESGCAVGQHGIAAAIGRLVSIGPELNVHVIDLCDDTTGEVRSFRADKLEELKD